MRAFGDYLPIFFYNLCYTLSIAMTICLPVLSTVSYYFTGDLVFSVILILLTLGFGYRWKQYAEFMRSEEYKKLKSGLDKA